MKDDHGLKDFLSFQQAAKEDFEQAYSKGFWRSIFSWLTQNKNELLPFDEVLKHFPIKGQHYIGLKQAPDKKTYDLMLVEEKFKAGK